MVMNGKAYNGVDEKPRLTLPQTMVLFVQPQPGSQQGGQVRQASTSTAELRLASP